MNPPPKEQKFDEDGQPSRIWIEWITEQLFPQASLDMGYGTTAERPVNGLKIGSRYFDTTLGYMVYYNGSGWVDYKGTSV